MNEEVKKEEGKKNIEVELKYQPTEEQMGKILDEAEDFGIKKFRSIYFDFDDFRLLKEGIHLRYRTFENVPDIDINQNSFELKIKNGHKCSEEIKDRKKIEKELSKRSESFKDFIKPIVYFGKTTKSIKSIEEFIATGQMKSFAIFNTIRHEYKKEGFVIDVDELDFGSGQDKYNLCEIELIINDENQKKEAKKRIEEFAKSFECEPVDSGKLKEYLRRFKPDLYKEIYIDRKNKEINKEKKNSLNNEIKMR